MFIVLGKILWIPSDKKEKNEKGRIKKQTISESMCIMLKKHKKKYHMFFNQLIK